jgi:hypothetical protein
MSNVLKQFVIHQGIGWSARTTKKQGSIVVNSHDHVLRLDVENPKTAPL